MGALAALVVGGLILPADGAPTWLPDIATIGAPGAEARDIKVAVNSRGDAAAVWLRVVGTQRVVEVSTRAATGPWASPTTLTAVDPYAIDGLGVAVDEAGGATIAWTAPEGTSRRIVASTRPAGGAWAAPVPVSPLGHNAAAPNLVVDASGTYTATWFGLVGGQQALESSVRDSSGVWSPEVVIGRQDSYLSTPPDVDAAGTVTAVWVFQGLAMSSSRPKGGAWSTPVTVSPAGADIQSLDLDVNAQGSAIMSWTRYTGTVEQVQASTRPVGGTWSAPVTVSSTNTVDDYGSTVALDPAGNAVVAWTRATGSGSASAYASMRPAGGAWSPEAALSTAPLGGSMPHVAMTAAGEAIATWSATVAPNRYAIASSIGTLNGTWSAPTTLSATTGTVKGLTDLAADAGGNATAVWTYDSGANPIPQSRIIDGAGPLLDAVSIPQSGHPKVALSFSVTPRDIFSAMGSVAWDFGDGAFGTSAQATHAYAAAGTYPVRVTVSDSLGNTTTQTGNVQVTSPAATSPQIKKFKLQKKQIKAKGKKAKTKALIRLTQKAKVKLVFKLVGKKKAVAKRTLKLKKGKNRFVIKTVVGKKRLKPGRYKIIARAKNANGTSKRVSVKLRVVR